MRSLLWKEWHEQRWKLAFTSLLLGGFTFCGLHARVIPDETVFLYLSFLAVTLLPLLVGAALIASERDARTLDTLLALPVQPSVVFAVKTLLGVILCIVPLAVACIVSLAMASGREMTGLEIVAMFVRCGLTTLCLFIWMLALTIRMPGETRSTLLGLGVLVGWAILTAGLPQRSGGSVQYHSLAWLWVVNPLVFLLNPHDEFWAISLPLASLVQAVIVALLWLWASRQLMAEEGRS